MPTDQVRVTVANEPKTASGIVAANPSGWKALKVALSHAKSSFIAGQTDPPTVATAAIRAAHDAGFASEPDDRLTRFTRVTGIMAFQDSLFAINELPEWRF